MRNMKIRRLFNLNLSRWKQRKVWRNDRPIRIGILSADFSSHPCGYVSMGLIEGLSHYNLLAEKENDKVKLYIYHSKTKKLDWVSSKIASLSDKVVTLPEGNIGMNMSFDACCKPIIEDNLDVLIDMSGHTQSSRLPELGTFPAPHIVSWFAYPSDTGCKSIGWRLTDPNLIGKEKPKNYGWVKVGCNFHSYSRAVLKHDVGWKEEVWPMSQPEIRVLKMQGKVKVEKDDDLRLHVGCFNNTAKLSDECIITWCNGIRKLSGIGVKGILICSFDTYKSRDVKTSIRQKFSRLGFDKCLGWELYMTSLSRDNYLKLYRHMDFMLDPFPYNGGVTSCETLLMGCPLVTLRGDEYVSRVSASLLDDVGLHFLAAENRAVLEDIIVELGKREGFWVGVRNIVRKVPVMKDVMSGKRLATELVPKFQRLAGWKCSYRCNSHLQIER